MVTYYTLVLSCLLSATFGASAIAFLEIGLSPRRRAIKRAEREQRRFLTKNDINVT